MADYDDPWKEALSVYFEPFMAFFFPQAHAEIDWSQGYESLDTELRRIAPKGELGRRAVDKLMKVWLRSGEEEWILVHVEVQMGEQGIFPLRVYVYNYRAFDLYNREVVSIAVLGDDNPRWRPDTFGYRRWGFRAEIQFPVVKLWDYADRLEELEGDANPFALVVAAHLRTLQTRGDDGQRFALKVKLIKGLYERGLSADSVRQLFRLMDWLMELPEPLDSSFWTEIQHYEQEKQMPFLTTPERLGLAKGRAEGIGEGLAKGIESWLRHRFGQEGLRLMPEIREIRDPKKLEAILEAAETVASPEDLRRLWAD